MPFNISFTRTFKHQPWTDSRDRVTADGENGFNVRFKALEADLDALHDRFIQVSAALNAVSTGGGADRVIAVPPLFTAINAKPWDLSTPGIARKPAANTQALGCVQVPMPASGVIASLTVVGRNIGSGKLFVKLYTTDASGAQNIVAQIESAGRPGDVPITVTGPADPEVNRIAQTSSYFIIAEAKSTETTDAIQINGLQITCKSQ